MTHTVSVTIVFTDLVGSTELASSVGPERAEELRQVHFGLLRSAVDAAGGTEVKNLGDGLMVAFPSVSAAVDGAVAMQTALSRRNRRARDPLSVRIGISAGDAVEDDGDYFGVPVIEAARLCARADGGEILAAKVVALLDRSASHQFEPVGDLPLKGLPVPVPTVRVPWTMVPADPEVPLPTRLDGPPGADTFVGRVDELAVLHEALVDTTGGAERVLFVAGEPGVGKTALVSEFARSAHRSGTTVLYGRSDEELAVPYQPWVEALGHLVEHLPEPLLHAHVAEHGPHVARLAPALLERVHVEVAPAMDAETERYLMFQSVCSLLECAAELGPIAVVLDDLHWADAPTLVLLRHVVGASVATPPLVVGTYRDSDVDRTHPLTDTLASLRRHPGFGLLAVRGLDSDEVTRLVEVQAGRSVPSSGRAFVDALRRETNGNPFFTREIVHDLIERGDLDRSGGGWPAAELLTGDRLPESVLAVVRQRVGRLGDEVRAALTAASIIGRDFDLALLARVLDQRDDVVLDQLERAVQASVIDEVEGPSDRYTFTHALGQHAMESELSAARRRRCHRRIAEAIEELWPGDPDERAGELARHWLAATTPEQPERAVHAAEVAGRRALDALAPDEATRWLRAALDLVEASPRPDPRRRARLLGHLGVAQRQLGAPEYRETLLAAASLAQEVGDGDTLVDAALSNNRGYHSNSGETDRERVAVLEAALDAVGRADSTRRALLLATLCAESNYHQPPSVLQELADEALAMAQRLGDARTISEVTSRTRVAVYFLETIEERFALYAESRRLAEEVADPAVCFHAAQALLWAAAARADFATVDEQLDTMRAVSQRTAQPILSWLTRYTESMRAAIAGDTERAERLAGEALELGMASGQPDAATFYGAQILRIRLIQGRLAELAPLVAQLADENAEFPVFRAVHAVASLDQGDEDTARRMIAAESQRGFDGIHEMQWATAMCLWTDVAVRLGHREAAEALYPLLVPFVRLTAFTGLTYGGSLAHFAGELAILRGDLDAAELHLRTAWEMEDGDGDPYLRARTLVVRARLGFERHRLDGDPEALRRARADLDAASELTTRFGFAAVAAEMARLGDEALRR